MVIVPGICLDINKDVKFEGNILSLNNFKYYMAQYCQFMTNNTNVTNLPPLSHISHFEAHTFMNAFESTGITEINETVFAKEITCDNDAFSNMFKNCKNLTKAVLPDIIVEDTESDTAPLKYMFNRMLQFVIYQSWF